jgi:hypothetical protein
MAPLPSRSQFRAHLLAASSSVLHMWLMATHLQLYEYHVQMIADLPVFYACSRSDVRCTMSLSNALHRSFPQLHVLIFERPTQLPFIHTHTHTLHAVCKLLMLHYLHVSDCRTKTITQHDRTNQ